MASTQPTDTSTPMTDSFTPLTPARPSRLLCVDDNEFVTEALARQLRGSTDLTMVGAVTSADTLLQDIERHEPDIVLLDMSMPGRDPLEAMAEVLSARPTLKVVVLSGYVRESLIDQAVQIGASGYLSKNEHPSVVIESLRRAAAGEFVLSPEVVAHYARADTPGFDATGDSGRAP